MPLVVFVLSLACPTVASNFIAGVSSLQLNRLNFLDMSVPASQKANSSLLCLLLCLLLPVTHQNSTCWIDIGLQ